MNRHLPLYAHVFLLLGIIFLPNLVIAYISPIYGDPGRLSLFLIFAVFIVALPILIASTLRHYFIFYIPFALISPIYAYYVYFFNSAPSEGIVAAVTRTTPGEFFDFLNIFGWKAAIPFACFSTYLYFSLRSRHLGHKITPQLKKLFLAVFTSYLLIAVLFFEYFSLHFDIRPVLDENMVRESFPLGLTITLSNVLNQDSSSPHDNFRFFAHKKDKLAEKEIYVLIIGESARYQNWGINGYHRQTTPRLSQFASRDLVSFSDMASSSNATMMAVPMLVSRATAKTFEITKKEGSVANAFKEAGFKTAWISNQDKFYLPPGMDFSDFRNDWDFHRYDENMLPIVDRTLKQYGGKFFLVIHTWGNHVDYDHRYPKRFKQFTPTLADLGQPVSSTVREALVNSYDNSVLSADDFIANIITMVNNHHAISTVFFVADHGENLFDDERKYFMHGAAMPSRYETHVPAFIWTSREYEEKYPGKHNALMQHKTRKVSHDNVFHTLLDMANIELPDEHLEMSIASEQFSEPAQRFILNQHWKTEVYERLK